MLTGKRAFQKPTSVETMSAILKEEPAAVSELTPGLPPALHRVIHRCLEKNLGQRFQSASDLAFALEAISDITQTRTSGIQSTPALLNSQYARLLWMILLGFAVIGTVALLVYWLNSAPEPPRIVNYNQITNDGRRKQPTGVEMTGMVNDGTRVFFTEGTGDEGLTPTLAQVSSEGGETVPIHVPFRDSVILDISPNVSELLVATYSANPDNDYALWAVPVLGGSPRRLSNVKSLFAAGPQTGRSSSMPKAPISTLQPMTVQMPTSW